MTALVSTVDGLGFEEVNQTTGNTQNVVAVNISGTNLYAKTAVTTPTVTATTLTNNDGELQSLGVGSGTFIYGAKLVAGSAATGTGSNAWVTFASSFSSNPIVNVTNYSSVNGEVIPVGSINVGSFYIETTNASEEFGWYAVGL